MVAAAIEVFFAVMQELEKTACWDARQLLTSFVF